MSTTQQPEALTHERDRAIMEGERNASLTAFDHDGSLTLAEERLYEAAFTNGWDRHAAVVAPTSAPMSPANRLVAYSAATRLRELGFEWDATAEAWLQPAQPAAQQGAAYAALPEPYCNAHDDADAFYPDMFSEQQMRAFADATCALRASHGQAPAGATMYPGCSHWGMRDKPPTAQAAPAAGAVAGPDDYTPLLDDEGRMMVGTSHHYTAENIRALVQQLRRFADPQQSTQADWDALDWRGWCNVLGRIVAALADEVPATHPTQQGLDARDAAFEAVRKAFCNLQRYSFWLDSRGNVRRCADRSGNWVEFEAAHTLFEPQSVDAALAAQAKKEGEKR